MSCNFCGGRLNNVMLRKQEPGSGRKFKSCPNCSTTHGEEHIFHSYPADFGNTSARVTAANPDGHQSNCRNCRALDTGIASENYQKWKVRTSPMCALRRLTGLDARRGSQQMALVLCKKHNTADRSVSHALRGFHSNRLSALSDFNMPRHAFSQMP